MLGLFTYAAEISAGTAGITTEMLQPLVDGVTSNIGIILPVGLGLFAIFLGIALVPKLIKKFTSN